MLQLLRCRRWLLPASTLGLTATVLSVVASAALAATVPLGSRSFDAACNAAAAGDTITVPAGSYGSQTITCTKAVDFVGQGNPTVAYVAFSNANGPSIDAMTLTGGFESKSSKNVAVVNSTLYNLSYIEGTSDLVMDHNVHTSAPGGTSWSNGDMVDIYEQTGRPTNTRITISDSVFHGLRAPNAASHSDAIQLCNCASAGDSIHPIAIKILRNRFYDNECMNIRTNANDDLLFEGNVIGDTMTGISGCGAYSTDVLAANATVRYNTWVGSQKIQVNTTADYGQSQTWIGNVGVGMSSSCGAIRGTYVNNVWTAQKCATSDKQVGALKLNSDGTPQAGSPVIDAGSMSTYPATDFDGTSRYSGAAPDAGAFEFDSGTPPPPADTTAPDTTITSAPADGTSTSASVAFSSSESPSTFECKLDSGAFAACASPKAYNSLAVGSHTVSVRATDAAGNTDASPAAATWTITSPPPPPDTTAPDTTITSAPADGMSTSASVAFTATESPSTFECKLDGGSFAACTSPTSYTGLALGSHTVSVRATDAAGNTDATPAAATWTISATPPPPDTTAPETTITSAPADGTSTSASVAFSSSESPSTFECKLDSGAFAACTSPKAYNSLAVGSHTFSVRATDAAANTDTSPAAVTWTISATPPPPDTTAPETTITSAPANGTATSGAFGFTASESGSSFECKLDGAAYTACTSPKSYTGQAVGSHTFSVRATDTAGNTDTTPDTATWTISATPPPPDTAAPTATITVKPTSGTTATTASFSFSGNDDTTPTGSLTYRCKLDTGSYAGCASPKGYTGLAVGSHTFSVRATDAAGNQTSAVSATWTIAALDTTDPTVTLTSKPSAIIPSLATSASFAFTGADNATPATALSFQCTLDGATAADCSSPATVEGLGLGIHTFTVTATDAAGNVSAPAAATWTVIAVPLPVPANGPKSHAPAPVLDTPVPPTAAAPLVAPTLSLLKPTTGAHFRSTLKAVAAATHDRSVDHVEFWLDSKRFAYDTAAPYTATLATDKVKAGAHTLVARAVDDQGLSSSLGTVVERVTGASTASSKPVQATATTGDASTELLATGPKRGKVAVGLTTCGDGQARVVQTVAVKLGKGGRAGRTVPTGDLCVASVTLRK